MNDPERIEEDFDWEQWPARRAEIVNAIRGLREQLAAFEKRRELDPLLASGERLIADLEKVITSGNEEYRKLHPGALFTVQSWQRTNKTANGPAATGARPSPTARPRGALRRMGR